MSKIIIKGLNLPPELLKRNCWKSWRTLVRADKSLTFCWFELMSWPHCKQARLWSANCSFNLVWEWALIANHVKTVLLHWLNIWRLLNFVVMRIYCQIIVLITGIHFIFICLILWLPRYMIRFLRSCCLPV